MLYLKNVRLYGIETDVGIEDGKFAFIGKTDKEGQLSRIELTKTFVEMQIEKAKVEEMKNAKMYKTLGAIVGLAFVIILI